ncbi:MAG TPA: N-6 DNA methylase [Candidatus Kapabacteria bacterium]|nr:N-6 DNA methylase [Candidatus Kapabacteria bacterium]
MDFVEYYDSIKKKIEQSTEYTLRTDFENLLNAIKPRKSLKIIQENKKTETQSFGKPDFKISENDLEIGWIETKPFKDDLSIYIDSPQLKRYLNVIPNFLFTNYREFILFRDGEPLLNSTLLIKGEDKLQESNIEKTKILMSEFFNSKIQQIEKTEKLSILLAKHAQYLHDELLDLWNSSEKSQFKEKLKGLFDLFSRTLIEDLKPSDFIDAYAQTVTYGLLLSALSATKKIDKYNFIEFIPKSLSIFEEIFGLLRLSNIPDGIAWIIDKLLIILNNTDYSQVQKELSFAYKKGREFEDPYIYFYENFLKAYNQEKRVEKGVYYTPAAVVHFIVKAVQQSLIKDFKKSGLDDDNISVLDFATGTGTFLLESFKTALENIDKGQKNGFIRNNLLENFFGFEYLIAPYTIAHLKLTKFLTEEGYKFEQDDRTKVFLTDTLDDAYYQRNPLFPYISDEGEQATKIKLEKKVWVVLGNPPYSNYSKNKKPFIQSLINDYKKGLQEAKINIDDDYIKFIRFAQAKIEGAKYSYKKGNNSVTGKIESERQGIVGIITNNSYLSGITHRQMRKSLYESFDKIYILNLHGNSIIGEGDKNVFDITVGVAIALFIKTPKPLKEKEVYYFSTLDNGITKREDKFDFLWDNDLETVNWKRLKPQEPYYWFVEKDFTHIEQYEKGWSLTKIFKIFNSGIKTDRDSLFIDKEANKLEKRIQTLFSGNYDKDFKNKYNVNDSGSYKLTEKLKIKNFSEINILKIHYRPFDIRYIYYQIGFTSRPSTSVHENINRKENLGLVFPRFAKGKKSNYGFISDIAIDGSLGGRHSGSETYIAPLYIYNSNGNSDQNGNDYLFKDQQKKDNFSKEFHKFLKENKLSDFTPEQILGYIYAILFSPTYREKYFEFLKIDFPKILFTKDKVLFEKLSELGTELIENHLLKRDYPKNEMPVFAVAGNNEVKQISYNEELQRLYINKTQYFENFLKSVWEYEIGGYLVFDKYLKARKEMELSYNEINHIKKVAASISKTIELQQNIDDICANWI